MAVRPDIPLAFSTEEVLERPGPARLTNVLIQLPERSRHYRRPKEILQLQQEARPFQLQIQAGRPTARVLTADARDAIRALVPSDARWIQVQPNAFQCQRRGRPLIFRWGRCEEGESSSNENASFAAQGGPTQPPKDLPTPDATREARGLPIPVVIGNRGEAEPDLPSPEARTGKLRPSRSEVIKTPSREELALCATRYKRRKSPSPPLSWFLETTNELSPILPPQNVSFSASTVPYSSPSRLSLSPPPVSLPVTSSPKDETPELGISLHASFGLQENPALSGGTPSRLLSPCGPLFESPLESPHWSPTAVDEVFGGPLFPPVLDDHRPTCARPRTPAPESKSRVSSVVPSGPSCSSTIRLSPSSSRPSSQPREKHRRVLRYT